ncbi:hypothetical protein [Nocardia aurea]|uniref:Uncharacterized protein n=1 Tax=Nocardia aurea TaxID=2144174 RepID=A0ABV3FT18_9NOCA
MSTHAEIRGGTVQLDLVFDDVPDLALAWKLLWIVTDALGGRTRPE